MSGSGTVHLIDDDEDVRRAVAFQLGTAGFAVRVYELASAFLEKNEGIRSGCVVSDVRMPGMDGLELLRRLHANGARLPVIIMTGHADVPLAVQAMKAGAIDFIEKPFSDEVLLAAIQTAFSGQPAAGRNGDVDAIQSRIALLSPREREVLEGLLAGHSNKVIANYLGISPRTVEVHRANVMHKMNVTSLSELVRMGLLAGIS